MLRSPKTNQRLERQLAFSIDGSVPELIVGAGLGALTENSDGNYTIVFTKPFARRPIAMATAITDVSTVRIVAIDNESVQFEQVGADQTTPLADADFDILVIGWDTEDEYGDNS